MSYDYGVIDMDFIVFFRSQSILMNIWNQF